MRGRRLALLLWKNLLLQRRHKIWTLCELTLPILFTAVLVILRQQVSSEGHRARAFDPFEIEGSWNDLLRKVDNRSILDIRSLYKDDIPFLPTVRRVSFITLPPTFLFFTPQSQCAVEIMKRLCDRFTANTTINIIPVELQLQAIGFANEPELIKAFLNVTGLELYSNSSYILGAVVFSEGEEGCLNYKMRLPNTMRNRGTLVASSSNNNSVPRVDFTWNTGKLYPFIKLPGPRSPSSSYGGPPGYWRETFLSLQKALDDSIIGVVTNQTLPRTRLERFTCHAYTANLFIIVVQRYLPVVLMISFVISVLYTTKTIVEEKEKRLKEYMKSMGLRNWLHWIAHFLSNAIKLVFPVLGITVLLCVPIHGKQVLTSSSPTLIFFFLLLYAFAALAFAFTASVFFTRANTGAAVAGVVWFLLFVPYFFLQPRYQSLSLGEKLASSLFLNTAMAYGAEVIGIFEGNGVGIQWGNFSQHSLGDNLSIAHVFLMFLVNIAMSAVITWYMEGVYPGDEGVPLPFHFPFTKSYWLGTAKKSNQTPIISERSVYYQRFPEENASIEISNLSKTYRKTGFSPSLKLRSFFSKLFGSRADKLLNRLAPKSVDAVKSLNLKLFPGQVTALLGRNGAGKSTTVSMLTGLIPSTGGNVRSNSSAPFHEELGLCPQYNCLFDNLTVIEHLRLFNGLKGKVWKESEGLGLLALLGLREKTNALAKNLSGGMKRKLSLAIAFIGGSKIVILDEPTSGMDPGARHDAWTLIQREKQERTLLLTTHYMEEADLLGDRLAILVDGHLKCYGTSLFLKHLYGAGYVISVVFNDNQRSYERVLSTIQKHCSGGLTKSLKGQDAEFSVPEETRHKFGDLFEELEAESGIASVGVAATSMEEVFLKVGVEEEGNETLREREDGISMSTITGEEEEIVRGSVLRITSDLHSTTNSVPQARERITGPRLLLKQFHACFAKKLICSRRDWKATLAQLFIPTILLILAILVNKRLPTAEKSPSLPLDLSVYTEPNQVLIFGSNETVEREFVQALSDGLPSNAKIYQSPTTNATQFMIESYRKKGATTVDQTYLTGARIECKGEECISTAYFNNEPYHTPAIALNMLSNAYLRHLGSQHSIRASNHPLPPNSIDKLFTWMATGVREFNLAFNLVFGMAFFGSIFLVFLVRERELKAKHLQLLAGLHPVCYWLATFLCDAALHLTLVGLLLVVFGAFGQEELLDGGNWKITLLLLVSFGWAILPLAYFASFYFSTPAEAFVKMTIYGVITGCVMMVVVTALYMLGLDAACRATEWVAIVASPHFCLGQGFSVFYLNAYVREQCRGHEKFCEDEFEFTSNSLAWARPGIGREVVFLALHGLLFWTLTMLKEFGLLTFPHFVGRIRLNRRKIYTEFDDTTGDFDEPQREIGSEDADVREERIRVSQLSESSEEPLLLRGIGKTYGDLVAVSELDLVIKQRECFGLLGPNGAGKTSTFKILTGETQPSSGMAVVGGIRVTKHIWKSGWLLGYCPQFDALIPSLTGIETLQLFGRLRGLLKNDIDHDIRTILELLGLTQYSNRLVKTYSGGTKRRLSLAVALIGRPQLLLLDEPTSGVDPTAKRLIWKALEVMRNADTAILFTSHSMEECENLCTRLGILSKGVLRCIGSPQYLKHKFRRGCTLQINVREMANVENTVSAVQNTFSGSLLKERHQTQLLFEIPRAGDLKWSTLFRSLNDLEARVGALDYSLSQTTLEDVLLRFSHGIY